MKTGNSCGTLEKIYVEPGEPELLCGTWEPIKTGTLNGTFMWNLAEPGSRFPAAAPNHPEAVVEEPQAFQAAGEKV